MNLPLKGENFCQLRKLSVKRTESPLKFVSDLNKHQFGTSLCKYVLPWVHHKFGFILTSDEHTLSWVKVELGEVFFKDYLKFYEKFLLLKFISFFFFLHYSVLNFKIQPDIAKPAEENVLFRPFTCYRPPFHCFFLLCGLLFNILSLKKTFVDRRAEKLKISSSSCLSDCRISLCSRWTMLWMISPTFWASPCWTALILSFRSSSGVWISPGGKAVTSVRTQDRRWVGFSGTLPVGFAILFKLKPNFTKTKNPKTEK